MSRVYNINSPYYEYSVQQAKEEAKHHESDH
jgi:hypothetical protein